MAKFDLRAKVIAFFQENPEKRATTREIGEWIAEKYLDYFNYKIDNFDGNKELALRQIVAEISSINHIPGVKREKVGGRLIFYSASANSINTEEEQTARVSTIPSEQQMSEKLDGDNIGLPMFEFFLLPTLKLMRDGQERHRREIFDCLNIEFQFSEEDKKQKYEKSGVYKLDGRMDWALRYLKHADLLGNTARGYFKITEQGQEVLRKHPDIIDKEIILQYAPADSKFFHPQKRDKEQINNEQESDRYLESYQSSIELMYGSDEDPESSQTPIELIEENYQKLKNSFSDELLENIKKKDPDFFEGLVVDLLIAMGYGGLRKEAGEAVGQSHDGGIDGIIKEDKLGLDIIYLQAKRYNSGSVGEGAIRNFVGALAAKHAQKGIFITTSGYSKSAREYVEKVPQKVILIDGADLVDFMIENNVGVSKDLTFEIKKIDLDYFE